MFQNAPASQYQIYMVILWGRVILWTQVKLVYGGTCHPHNPWVTHEYLIKHLIVSLIADFHESTLLRAIAGIVRFIFHLN